MRAEATIEEDEGHRYGKAWAEGTDEKCKAFLWNFFNTYARGGPVLNVQKEKNRVSFTVVLDIV